MYQHHADSAEARANKKVHVYPSNATLGIAFIALSIVSDQTLLDVL